MLVKASFKSVYGKHSKASIVSTMRCVVVVGVVGDVAISKQGFV